MRKIYKIVAVVTAVIGLIGGLLPTTISAATTKTKGTLTIGLEGTYAPYSYREKGKLTGFEVELGQNIAKKMNLKSKIVTSKWDSLIAGVGDKKFDVAINNITETKERKAKYAFSDPYIYSRTVLITKKGSTLKSVNNIKNRTLAESTGTENEMNAKKLGAKTIPSENFADTVSLIQQGRADASLNSREAVLTYLKEHPKANIQWKSVPTSKIPVSKISILMNKNNPKLKKQVNQALKELRQDGTLKKLSNKYFSSDITENPDK